MHLSPTWQRWHRGLLLGCLLLAIATSGLAADRDRDYFTDLPLVNQQGQEVRFYSDLLQDRVVLISGFFMDCTNICPIQLKVLSDLQALLLKQHPEALGQDLQIISLTLDPRHDTPERVKTFADAFSKGPGWTFLSGKPENIDWVNRKLGKYTEQVENHTAFYLIGNLRTGEWLKVEPTAQAKGLLELLQKQLASL